MLRNSDGGGGGRVKFSGKKNVKAVLYTTGCRASVVATFINRAIEVTASRPVTRVADEAGKTPIGMPASLLFPRDVVN